MKEELIKNVESLIKQAAYADKAEDAMKYSQAACNAANAMCSLSHALGMEPKKE